MRSFLSFIFVLGHVCLSAQEYQGDSWARIQAKGSGTLGVVYYEQPGLIAQTQRGEFAGVCVDILSDFQKFIETKYGKRVTVKYVGEETKFSEFLEAVQLTPHILGVTNTSITEERKKVMKFTPAYMSTQLVLLSNKNAPSITSLSDLKTAFAGFSAQVVIGSTHVQQMEAIKRLYYPDLTIVYVSSSDEVISNLSRDPQLLAILDFTEYIGLIRKKIPVKKQEVEIGERQDLGFVMSKQSDWDGVWNEFFTPEYRRSERYRDIIAENLGSLPSVDPAGLKF
jgi:ABC-type amino acid transport substrate-binding protein